MRAMRDGLEGDFIGGHGLSALRDGWSSAGLVERSAPAARSRSPIQLRRSLLRPRPRRRNRNLLKSQTGPGAAQKALDEQQAEEKEAREIEQRIRTDPLWQPSHEETAVIYPDRQVEAADA